MISLFDRGYAPISIKGNTKRDAQILKATIQLLSSPHTLPTYYLIFRHQHCLPNVFDTKTFGAGPCI